MPSRVPEYLNYLLSTAENRFIVGLPGRLIAENKRYNQEHWNGQTHNRLRSSVNISDDSVRKFNDTIPGIAATTNAQTPIAHEPHVARSLE